MYAYKTAKIVERLKTEMGAGNEVNERPREQINVVDHLEIQVQEPVWNQPKTACTVVQG